MELLGSCPSIPDLSDRLVSRSHAGLRLSDSTGFDGWSTWNCTRWTSNGSAQTAHGDHGIAARLTSEIVPQQPTGPSGDRPQRGFRYLATQAFTRFLQAEAPPSDLLAEAVYGLPAIPARDRGGARSPIPLFPNSPLALCALKNNRTFSTSIIIPSGIRDTAPAKIGYGLLVLRDSRRLSAYGVVGPGTPRKSNRNAVFWPDSAGRWPLRSRRTWRR
jgi:hypothetical protein